jgi:hypothetical protein
VERAAPFRNFVFRGDNFVDKLHVNTSVAW